ncbi:MAG TPA: hypothetical protein VIM22_01620, partial [Solirubrobacteraceae bacterium]
RSYEDIGEMLDLPPARVRELARDALAELAPFTAELVDPQWRGQLADYVLGQQTGPEAHATRGHLRRSEPARIWTYSLLDALDDFYEDGDRPEIPVGEAGGSRSRGARDREAPTNGEAPAVPVRPRPAARGALSPEARSALLRRRIMGGLAALAVLALLVFGAVQIFGGSDKKKTTGAARAASTATPAAAQGQGTVVAQAILVPTKGIKGQGVALVYQTGKTSFAVVRATVPPSTGADKYVLWLYNSEKQLVPLAADVTDKQGNFQGAAALPSGWQNYRFFDLTLQSTAGKTVKHGRSVMRGPLTAPTAAQQQGSAGTGTTGTGTGTGTSTTP